MKTRITICLVLGVLLFCGGLAQATNIDFNSVNPVGTIQAGNNYNQVTLHDSAVVTMTGGSAYSVWSYDSSTFHLQGGNVTEWISVYNASNLIMSGGSVLDLEVHDSGVASISGGNITGYLGILSASNTGIVHIYGKNWNFIPVGGGLNGWMIGGNWADNSLFSIFYRTNQAVPLPGSSGSNIVLHTIPEPATLFLLLLGIGTIRKLGR